MNWNHGGMIGRGVGGGLGLGLGTADVAYYSNVVCGRICIQGAWLWMAIAERVGHSLSVLSG